MWDQPIAGPPRSGRMFAMRHGTEVPDFFCLRCSRTHKFLRGPLRNLSAPRRPHRRLAQLRGVALSGLGELDDVLGDRSRRGPGALDNAGRTQSFVEGVDQHLDLLWSERVVMLKELGNGHGGGFRLL